MNDTSLSLTQVVAETDKNGNEKSYYTRSDELISMEKGKEVWYYLYDGHGSVRTLTNEAGRVTDRYSYDAYGILLEKEGDTENEFLYTGEQYNANTGLYYLRARYMNPSTGTFISMDTYQGSIYDPVSLHKYLYANANPVMYTDPSGYDSEEILVSAEGTAILTANQAWVDSVIFAIGRKVMFQLRAIETVEAVSYFSSFILLSLVVDDALVGGRLTDEAYDVAVEILQYARDNIEIICEEAGIASDAIAEKIRTAIYEAKNRGKGGDKGKGGNKGRDKTGNADNTDNKTDSKGDVSDDEKTADELLSEDVKGNVRRKFPSEWLDKTKKEIERAAKSGNAAAKRAKKLLTDNRFKQESNSTASKKGK